MAELFEERQSLEDMASRLAVERSCELAAAERAEQLAAAEQGVQELELATQEAWQALEEEAKAMGERLELAEQFTEGYERRNSELAEQLTGKRKERGGVDLGLCGWMYRCIYVYIIYRHISSLDIRYG